MCKHETPSRLTHEISKSTQPVLSEVGFEVLAAVAMKSSVFWDIMPCSVLEEDVHLQGRKEAKEELKISVQNFLRHFLVPPQE
jgi:hypothetical protein